MVYFRTTILILLFLAKLSTGQTFINGGAVEGHWELENSPYIVTQDIYIDIDDRLTVEAGVEVYFNASVAMEIFGRIDVSGTEASPVIFSAIDTTGFSSGTFNGWYGMGFIGFAGASQENSTLENCIVSYSAGSGLSCMQYNRLEISNSSISNNLYYGINLMDNSDIAINSSVIEKNGSNGINVQFSAPVLNTVTVRNNGGSGINVDGHSSAGIAMQIENSSISYNHSPIKGGGVNAGIDAIVDLTNVYIHHNSSTLGGGVYAGFANITITESNISNNTSQNGGGLFMGTNTNADLSHVLVAKNTALESGGGMQIVNATLNAVNLTITDNNASVTGGAVYYDLIANQTNVLSNSICWQNSPDEITYSGYATEVSYTDVMGGFDGTGNINAAPRFLDAENEDYQLSWAGFPADAFNMSPCIDSGDPHSPVDPDGSQADMGAYYFHQPEAGNLSKLDNGDVGNATIYPNPASSQVNIRAEQEITNVMIISLSGQVVAMENSMGRVASMDVSHLQKGIYILKYENVLNGSVESEKLIIE